MQHDSIEDEVLVFLFTELFTVKLEYMSVLQHVFYKNNGTI